MKRYNLFQAVVMEFVGVLPHVSWLVIAMLFLVPSVKIWHEIYGQVFLGIAAIAIACAIVRWRWVVTVDNYKNTTRQSAVLLRRGTDANVEAGRIFLRRRGDEFKVINLPEPDENGAIVIPFAFGKDDLPEGVKVKGEVHLKLVKSLYDDRTLPSGLSPEELWVYAQNGYSVEMALSRLFTEAARNNRHCGNELAREYHDLMEYVDILHTSLQSVMWSKMPKTVGMAEIYVSASRDRVEITMH